MTYEVLKSNDMIVIRFQTRMFLSPHFEKLLKFRIFVIV